MNEPTYLDAAARWLRRLIVLVVAGYAVAGWFGNGGTPRPGPGVRPVPAPDAARPAPLPPAPSPEAVSRRGVRYVDAAVALPPVRGRIGFAANRNEAGKTYVGTAFATHAGAVWATARHVVEGCRRIELRHGGSVTPVTGIVHDRAADLSLVYAPTGGALTAHADTPLPLDAPGLDGFGMGFPGGTPASVHLSYLGRVAAQSHDGTAGSRWSPGGLWQIEHSGLFDQPELGGISGGPLLDRDGALIGILVGGQPRRARAISLDPANLAALLHATGDTPTRAGWHHAGLAPANADAARQALVARGLLALVVCRA